MSAFTRTAPATWGTTRIGAAFAAIALAVVLAAALVFIALSAVAPASNVGANPAAGSLSSTDKSGTMYDRKGADAVVSKDSGTIYDRKGADAVVSKDRAIQPGSLDGARGLRPR